MTAGGVLADLTATDMALVTLTVCSVLALVVVLFAMYRLLVAVRAVTVALNDVTAKALPLVDELAESLAEANEELARVDRLVGSAESISATVDATSKLAYRALSAPVIKTVAVTSGASRAARRLRGEANEKA